MSELNDTEIRALRYIKNTGGEVPVEAFDDDHEPIGRLIRKVIVPVYATISNDFAMQLTPKGEELVK